MKATPKSDVVALARPGFVKAQKVFLRGHPTFNERWVQDVVYEDPSLLGLGGDLVARAYEKRQTSSGRLDLLLEDTENNKRYEVELMTGALDESHIIRAIEYYDIERRRFPGYEHCAVIVAEDCSRFLNVISLFTGSIPIIVLQMNALKVGEHVTLHFAKVIDQATLRQDEDFQEEVGSMDRAAWVGKSSERMLELVDSCLDAINEVANPKQRLTYNVHYVGLSDGVRNRNFVHFKPKSEVLHVKMRLADDEAWSQRFEAAGAALRPDGKFLRVTVTPKNFVQFRELLNEALRQAAKEYNESLA